MKTFRLEASWRALAFLLISLLPPIAGLAQEMTPVGSKVDTQTLWRIAMADAKALAIEGKIVQAENALTRFNFTKPGSAEWHEQTAVQLTRLIAALALDGNEPTQRAVAGRALENLQSAEKLAGSPGLVAQARQQAGRIQERTLQDFTAAKESYRRALVADPLNQAAKGALGRLEKADEEIALKDRIKG